MTTARDLCLDALSECGSIGVGQTPNAEDINAAFTRLQRMVKVWQAKRWLIPSLQEISFIADGSLEYSIGLGGDIDIKRPNDIKTGWMIQRNTGSNRVSLPLKKIFSYEDWARITVKELNSLPDHFFYDAQFPLGHIKPWPIPNNQYELHFLIQSGLHFGTTINIGSILTGGAAGVDAIYENIELTGGTGTGATATLTVTAGAVAVVNLLTGGKDYVIGDILTADPADIGGVVGFTWKVDDVTSNIDTEIIMAEEYEEALMYNLSWRMCSYYQEGVVSKGQVSIIQSLAKAGLNTIRQNNTQIPSLTMPAYPGVRTGKAFNIYNADGY